MVTIFENATFITVKILANLIVSELYCNKRTIFKTSNNQTKFEKKTRKGGILKYGSCYKVRDRILRRKEFGGRN